MSIETNSRELQGLIASHLRVFVNIDSEEEIKIRVDFLKNYLKESKTEGFVLGISGGQDSTLAGMLAKRAIKELKEEGISKELILLRLPYGSQKDRQDAVDALEWISPTSYYTIDIKKTVDALVSSMPGSIKVSDYHKGNIKARVRMTTQYAVAGEQNLLVIGTDHAAEAVVGFFTKFGDGAADILPLSGLTKRQGRALLEHLGCPEHLYLKAPTADLLDDNPGRTDEDELGVTYEQIDDYLECKETPREVETKIITRFYNTMHKRDLPIGSEWIG